METERESEKTAWSWPPLPDPGPSAKQPFLRPCKAQTHLRLLPRARPASLDQTEGSPSRAGRKDWTRKKPGFKSQDRVCQTEPTPTESPHPQSPYREANI